MSIVRILLRASVGAAVSAVLASPIHAQVGSPLTLPEALARAEAQAPALAQASAGIAAAKGRQRQAGAAPNPVARLGVENFAGSGGYSGLTQSETTFAIGQTIELGGKREARVSAGAAAVAVAEIQAAVAHADLVMTVRKAFSNALAAQDQVALARTALARAQDLATVSQTLVDAGREPPLRALRAKAAAAQAEAELERRIAEDKAARGSLGALFGDTAPPPPVAGRLEDTVLVSALVDPARTLNVRLAEADANAARAAFTRERAAANVDVDVELGVRSIRESRDTALVFGATVPIPIFNRNQGAISAASAEVNGANARRLQALADTVREMREAESTLAAAESRVKTLQSTAQPAAAEALALARAGFEAGRFSLLDVLDAEDAFASAQSSLIEAQRDRANAAAALERAQAR